MAQQSEHIKKLLAGCVPREQFQRLPLQPCINCARLERVDKQYVGDDGNTRDYTSRECTHYNKRIPQPRRVCRCRHLVMKGGD